MLTTPKKMLGIIVAVCMVFSFTAVCNAQSPEGDILSFSTPFSFTENFSVSKDALAESIGSVEAYSQYASVKYHAGSDISTVATGDGIRFSDSKESISVSSLHPVTGSYIFDFSLEHPEFNNLSSAAYIGVRSAAQFTDMTAYNLSEMPADGVWLGISYNNVGIGTKLVSGSSSKRFSMGDDFYTYTDFRVIDDRENNVVYYYASNGESSMLFAKAELTYSEETTTVNYTVYTPDGEENCSVEANGIIADDITTPVYPQLQLNKYLCALTSFGVTCEADENATLSGITLEGAELSEDISLDITEYDMKMPVSGEISLSVSGNPGISYRVYADDEEIPMLNGTNLVTIAEKSALYIEAYNGVVQTVYTFNIVDNTHTVTVIPTNCSVDGESTLVIDYDGTATFNIVPDAGYDFSYVTGGANYTEETVNTVRSGVLTVENVTEDMEIELVFELRKAIELTIGSATVAQGETVDIPISIGENSGAIAGSFNILYDHERLDFLGPVTTGCVSVGNRNLEPALTPGKLGFFFISKNLGLTPLTAGGVLIYARFTVKDDAADGEEPISVSFETNGSSQPSINDWEGPRVVNSQDGIITFLTPDDGKYILKTAVAEGIGGTVTPGTRLAPGQKTTLKATASTGYAFSHWEADNGKFSSTTMASTTYTMGDGPTTAYAHFKIKTYNINTSVSGNTGGTISSSADVVDYGGSVTVTLNPYPGYEVSAFTVNNKDKLSSLVNNTYTLSSIKNIQTMVVTYKWVGADIIEEITPLRAYEVDFDNTDRTITVKASKRNTSAGFALDIAGDETTGSYVAQKGMNLSQGTTGGKKYIVARRSAGNVQNFELYITYAGIEYTYNVTFMFTENPDSAGVIDLASASEGRLVLDTANYKASLTVDRYLYDKAEFGLVIPQDAEVSYELVSTTSGKTDMSLVTSADYTCVNNGNYDEVEMVSLPASNGVTQKLKATVTNGDKVNVYNITVAFRDLSYEGDVRPVELLPLRLSTFSIDCENKQIYAETVKGAASAGFGFDMGGEPPTKLTCLSGCGLAYGNKDGYRYIVSRQSYGLTQTYRVKLYGEDGYEYSWYTVTMVYK